MKKVLATALVLCSLFYSLQAKANGFRLCPVVPDDYAGMNLDSYADTVQDHLHAVEEKMNEVIKKN